MLIYGHRGSRGTDPENTRRAFLRAITNGADGVELDVHVSADGVPVVIHDSDVDRTTNGTGPVASMSLAELRRLDAGDGERVPTLDEVFELLAGKLQIDVEIKQPGIELQVLEVAARHPDAVWFISCFDWSVLVEIRRIDPDAVVWPLASEVNDELFAVAQEVRSPGVALLAPAYTAETAARFATAGLQVGTWTVNDAEEARRMRDLGASILMTDYPAAMRIALSPQPD